MLIPYHHMSIMSICPATISVYKAYFKTLYLIFIYTLTFLTIARPIPPIVDNPTSDRLSTCGVAFTMYSNYRFNLQALMLAVFSILVFHPHCHTLQHLLGGPSVTIFESLVCWFNHAILGVI